MNNRRPSREAPRATYYAATCGSDVRAALALARQWRACGDHIAAGDVERDAAALVRANHTRLAREWDRQAEEATTSATE